MDGGGGRGNDLCFGTGETVEKAGETLQPKIVLQFGFECIEKESDTRLDDL